MSGISHHIKFVIEPLLIAIPCFAFFEGPITSMIEGIQNNCLSVIDDVINGIKEKNSYIMGYVSGGMDVTKKIGYSMIVIFFGWDFYEKATSDSFNVEHFIKQLLKAIIGILFIDEGLAIVKTLMDIGLGVYSQLSSVFSGASTPTITLGDTPVMSFFESVLFALVLLLLWLLSFLAKGFMAILIAGLFVEFYVRAIFFPIAAADAFGGSRQGAVKYLRTMLAMCLQLGVVAASQAIVNVTSSVIISAGVFSDLTGQTVMAVLMVVAQIGFILKAGSIAKEVVGG